MAVPVLEKFKDLYGNASKISASSLADVYAEDVVFADPVHHIEGRDNLALYLDKMYSNVNSCRFHYIDQLIQDQQACIRWDMHFSHKKLAGGREVLVRGVTLVEFNSRIHRHEDFFDMGSMLYENVPVLGSCVKYLKGRIS